MKSNFTFTKIIVLYIAIILLLSSCGITLPSFHTNRQSNGVTINYPNSQIEPLKKQDYTVLKTTTGKASTKRFYILFIPIGKHKSNDELYNIAYNNAVENLPNADALILPRQETKKYTIPLLLVNFNKRTTTVSGVGIAVNDKIIENTEKDIPHTIINGYQFKNGIKSSSLKKNKITTQLEFQKYFELVDADNISIQNIPIDYTKEYVIAIVGKSSKKLKSYDLNYLRYKDAKIKLSYSIEENGKQVSSTSPILLLKVDKKFQGNLILKSEN